MEKTHRPIDQESSKRFSPRRAASVVTCCRVAPLAVGTGFFIEPETSTMQSIRPESVAMDQLDTARSTASGAEATGGDAALGRRRDRGVATGGARCALGRVEPAPQLPSGARSDCAASLSLNDAVVSASNSTPAADALAGSIPGNTAYG